MMLPRIPLVSDDVFFWMIVLLLILVSLIALWTLQSVKGVRDLGRVMEGGGHEVPEGMGAGIPPPSGERSTSAVGKIVGGLSSLRAEREKTAVSNMPPVESIHPIREESQTGLKPETPDMELDRKIEQAKKMRVKIERTVVPRKRPERSSARTKKEQTKREIESILSVIEDQYRDSMISEKTYRELKEKNEQRLRDLALGR